MLETISRAAGALLGAAATDLRPDAHFNDLGGDSLSALTFANLLHEIFDIDVPVGVIVSPATDLQVIADYIEAERTSGAKRPTFAAVHGRDATEVHARDLTLDKFLDATTLAAAPALPPPSAEVRTVLLTGATGFLGRYLALEWLERMDLVGGKLICLVRAKSNDDAARGAWTRPSTAAIRSCCGTTGNWPPSIWRSSPATRPNRTSAWITRPGNGWPTPSI